MTASQVDQALVERLSQLRALDGLPRQELEWMVAHGELWQLPAGHVVAASSGRMDYLYVLFSGRIAIWVDRGAGRRKAMEWRRGDVTGLLPYSRMTAPPGDSFAEEPVEALAIHKSHFPELIRECPELAARMVHTMLDRARAFQSSDLLDEKMVSLGKLSAGLAHELNNPASAAARSAKILVSRLADADNAARALGAMQLDDAALANLDRVRSICLEAPRRGVRSPLEQADREDLIAEWLRRHGVDPDAAAALAETEVTLETLDKLSEALPREALDPALRWIASGCATRTIAAEIEKAAMRIYELVAAVKRFTHMDRAAVDEAVDLTRGLSDTLMVLSAKARDKSVGVKLEIAPDLPAVEGDSGQLNQVWSNLLDNALDAVQEGGSVNIRAGREGSQVVVRVIDDGPGVAPDLRQRIFDPFFTTKPVGQGTGLGLDIARRVVRRHNGEITVKSEPGRTEFIVTLPALGS